MGSSSPATSLPIDSSNGDSVKQLPASNASTQVRCNKLHVVAYGVSADTFTRDDGAGPKFYVVQSGYWVSPLASDQGMTKIMGGLDANVLVTRLQTKPWYTPVHDTEPTVNVMEVQVETGALAGKRGWIFGNVTQAPTFDPMRCNEPDPNIYIRRLPATGENYKSP